MARSRGRALVAAGVAALALLVGCGSGADDAGGDADAEGAAGAAADGSSGGGTSEGASAADPAGRIDPAQRSIVHRMELVVEVEDVAAASDRAAQLVSAAQGFVARESTSAGEDGGGSAARATLTLRVPVAAYDQLVADLAALGEVQQRDRSAEDVTEQLVDVDSRIATQQRSIQRVRALLDAATGIDQVVALESELARREADLESLQARLAELSDLADLATVTAVLAAPGTVALEDAGFVAGVRGGWEAFTASLVVVATVLGAVLPFAVAAAVVGARVWLVARAVRRRRPAAPPPPPATPGPPTPAPPAPEPAGVR